jgi:hypothetical protein
VSIDINDLTGSEQAVLLVLMAESRPVTNPELARLGPELRAQNRAKLNRLKLIDSTKVGRSLVHELTDEGWYACKEFFGASPPPRSSGQGKALYAVLAGLRRYFDRANLAPGDVFLPAEHEDAVPDGDVDDRVRSAYGRLATRPGGWVGLVRLRAELADVSRRELDTTLVRMYSQRGVSLIPEENQKVLSTADHEAAVEIGGQDKHLIAIEQ